MSVDVDLSQQRIPLHERMGLVQFETLKRIARQHDHAIGLDRLQDRRILKANDCEHRRLHMNARVSSGGYAVARQRRACGSFG